ncbi:von Willebrand factor type A domain-containing protein, partial [Halovenus aranensis]
EMGVRTVTEGVSADDGPLIDDEVVVTADVDGDCFVQATPTCPDCTTPDPGTDDFDVSIESVDNSGFPTVEVTARIDTTAGGNGDLDASNFGICEETVDGLGDGFCGQTIQAVRFGGEQEETLADIMFVLDTSGSMIGSKIDSAKDGAIQLVGGDTDRTNDANAGGFDPTVNAGLVEFDGDATLVSPLGTDQNQLEDDIAGLTGGGTTDLGAGISTANTELQNSQSNRANAPDFMIVLGNGDTSNGAGPADTAKNNGTTIFGIAYGDGASVTDFEDISGEVPSDPNYQDYTFDADQDDITTIFDEIGQEIFGTYTIEYETANFATDGTDRNVRVYVDDPSAGDADTTGSYTSPSS